MFLALNGKTINIFSVEIQGEVVTPKEDIPASETQVGFSAPPFDERKLRNHWPYLAEGKGGMGVLLNEKEAMVTRVLGQATRRSFDTFDEMYFERRTFSGIIYIYKGLVSKLRYHVKENQIESLKWKTAGGLRQEMIERMSEEEAKKFIIDFYKNFKQLDRQGSLLIYSKGIGFYWLGNKLRFIEIFEPWHLPQ